MRAAEIGGVRTGVTSVCCEQPFGELRFALPSTHGAVAACIGRVARGAGFVPVVVAPPLTW
jgi:hypothetical protein